MSTNRIVALLTPVFTAVAGIGSGYVAKHTGLVVNPDELLAVESFAATSALAAALKWLHGWQAGEKYKAALDHDLAIAEKYAQEAGVNVPSTEELEKAAEKKFTELSAELAGVLDGAKIKASAEVTDLQNRLAVAQADALAAQCEAGVAKTELATHKARLATVTRALAGETGPEAQAHVKGPVKPEHPASGEPQAEKPKSPNQEPVGKPIPGEPEQTPAQTTTFGPAGPIPGGSLVGGDDKPQQQQG